VLIVYIFTVVARVHLRLHLLALGGLLADAEVRLVVGGRGVLRAHD
jgi:hypothetical protein